MREVIEKYKESINRKYGSSLVNVLYQYGQIVLVVEGIPRVVGNKKTILTALQIFARGLEIGGKNED
jgi:hypothetical protein